MEDEKIQEGKFPEKRFAGKEHVLNHTAQRFQLTRPKAVGPVMELIRECQPKTIEDWEAFYWSKAFTKTKQPEKITPEIIDELGTRLFEKIQAVIIPEWTKAFQEITLQDCIDYIIDVTVRRTFGGFQREKSVVHDNLAHDFPEIEFKESDSDLDHSGDIDYIAVIKDSLAIGIQIKPVTTNASFGSYSPTARMKKNFEDFKEKYGGNVFVVYSEKEKIKNPEVLVAIRKEINDILFPA